MGVFSGPRVRLPYRYFSKNVSGYRCHPRSVVAYSAEAAHHAVLIWYFFQNSNNIISEHFCSCGDRECKPIGYFQTPVYFTAWFDVIQTWVHSGSRVSGRLTSCVL